MVTFWSVIPLAVIAVGVPSGYAMLQERVTLQLFPPMGMVQEEDEGERDPDMVGVTGASQVVPFQSPGHVAVAVFSFSLILLL